MELPVWSEGQRQGCLGCLEQVAALEGGASPHQAQFIESLGDAFGIEGAGESLGAAPWADIGARFPEDSDRLLVLQGCILMAMADGAVGMDEVLFIEEAQRQLGVTEPRTTFLRLYAEGKHQRMQMAILMGSKMIQGKFWEAWRLGGIWAVLIFISFPFRLFGDKSIEAKYGALGAYPEGSFGRAYFDHLNTNGFTVPGVKGSFPEVLAAHDYAHVLGGFGTDALGECEVIAFITGFIGVDPFWYIFAIVTHMHLDLEIFMGDPTAHMAGDPRRMVDAFRRGQGMTQDLYDAWDPWEDFSLPLSEVRVKYGVDVGLPAGVG